MIDYKTRERIFNWLMVNSRKLLYFILNMDIHQKYKISSDEFGYIPLLSVNPKLKTYRFNCYCFDCPCNQKGLCATEFHDIPISQLHEFDGDNIVMNFCG